ncbi:MAG: glycosyltransferase [Phycisphaerales bacterium]|nr:glycosyltransferase [Phycisphaerales bacterium]
MTPPAATERSVGGPVLVFAGGGTGGHLYPALAIAEAVAERCPGARCVFACSERPLDGQILEKAGVEFASVPARPFGLRPRTLLKFVWGWGAAVRSARALLRRTGATQVVAMGGFVAAPVVQAARAERLPISLVNLDAVPGKANRWIARHAGAVFTAAEPGEGEFGGWTRVRPIVRKGAAPPVGESPQRCRERLGLAAELRTLLVTGGSQGASTLNGFVARLAEREPRALEGWQVLHLAGSEDAARELAPVYRAAGVPAAVLAYCDDMGRAWGSADLAVSRSGAGAVAEAWAAGVPALFLPYPFHRDQHQRANAAALEKAGGAVIETDRIDASANDAALSPVLRRLLTDRGVLAGMREAMRRLGPADGAARVAEALAGG